MQTSFGVTIATNLSVNDIHAGAAFAYKSVIDLRCDNSGAAVPIDETVLRKLRNFHIGYQQFPVDLSRPSNRAENELFRRLTEHNGIVLIITDDAACLARFCQELNIPFSSRELYVVETAFDDMPVQLRKPEADGNALTRLAS